MANALRFIASALAAARRDMAIVMIVLALLIANIEKVIDFGCDLVGVP